MPRRAANARHDPDAQRHGGERQATVAVEQARGDEAAHHLVALQAHLAERVARVDAAGDHRDVVQAEELRELGPGELGYGHDVERATGQGRQDPPLPRRVGGRADGMPAFRRASRFPRLPKLSP